MTKPILQPRLSLIRCEQREQRLRPPQAMAIVSYSFSSGSLILTLALIAISAIVTFYFALAQFFAAVHLDRAFQASSPIKLQRPVVIDWPLFLSLTIWGSNLAPSPPIFTV
jgi:hypothetical protein